MAFPFYAHVELGKKETLDDNALLTGAKAGNQTAPRHLLEKHERDGVHTPWHLSFHPGILIDVRTKTSFTGNITP